MIELLFTTSDYKFSRLARWALDSDCSHFAVRFDRRVIFHSNFLGVHIEPWDTFKQHNAVVHCLTINTTPSLEQEEELWQRLIRLNYGQPYDYGAMLFLGLNLIGKRLFNLPLSKNNLWMAKESFICTELLESLSGLKLGSATFPDLGNVEMTKPHDLYLELSGLPFITTDSLESYQPA